MISDTGTSLTVWEYLNNYSDLESLLEVPGVFVVAKEVLYIYIHIFLQGSCCFLSMYWPSLLKIQNGLFFSFPGKGRHISLT